MKVVSPRLLRLCAGLDDAFVAEHVSRLGSEYFRRFRTSEVAAHVCGLARLSAEAPVGLILRTREGGRRVDLTVLAYDYPFEFSAITGVLSGMGFSIQSGDVFTYSRAPGPAAPRVRRGAGGRVLGGGGHRRRIIDHFSGVRETGADDRAWEAELRARMTEAIGLFERGDADSVRRAKQRVNEWVTDRLASQRASASPPVLYPVEIRVDTTSGPFTRLRVVGQDTPAFLYSLSTALSLHGLSIERVQIRTRTGRVEDEIDLVDLRGAPVRDPEMLDRVRLSVLFTKQFTYFLDRAPDPYMALSRFEQLTEGLVHLPDRARWRESLANPRLMQELARLLGASDFLWEDFIRLQYESLLPVLKPRLSGEALCEPVETLPGRLNRAVRRGRTFEERRQRLNEFKDREMFRMDVDHILAPEAGFRTLSERLTALAEAVVGAAACLVYDHLARRYGEPRTVAGMPAAHALFGLGKLGGAALGYASDLELLFVYGDQGHTSGRRRVGNDEFFAQLARETAAFITAKRDGIFHVDLRLRPHGQSGPLACSLESFCRYYGPGGPAHSYERLALVRLRALAGDPGLGAQVERLRDEFIYTGRTIRIADLEELRAKQLMEKTRPGEYNAKFSPGAMVDLEYTVQILQVLYAAATPALRTPRIHQALEALREAGVVEAEECDRLIEAYDFLRHLINGLRMLRGSARDLLLPPSGSDEFAHLARRMGYERRDGLRPEQRLSVEFDSRTAAVRAFVERHLGRAGRAGSGIGNAADLVLLDEAPDALRDRVLGAAGFRDPVRALTNLRRLAGTGARRSLFAQIAVLALDMLRNEPDADMALNNWERLVGATPDAMDHFGLLLSQPRRLELLLRIFSRSQYMADTLVRHPEFFEWATAPEQLQGPAAVASVEADLRREARQSTSHAEWRLRLNRFRQRHHLRIGLRDLCLRAEMRDVTLDLSRVAEAVVRVALEQAWTRQVHDARARARAARDLCVLAFGKLGGRELNYSSDIDLLALRREAGEGPPAEQSRRLCQAVVEALRSDLSDHTAEGRAYRVDLRLRPYGRSGELVPSVPFAAKYYATAAGPWEIQALLRLRPIAGARAVGLDFLRCVGPVLRRPHEPGEVIDSIRRMRGASARKDERSHEGCIDVKNGEGGIRDIEFLVQGLQMIHLHRHPRLATGHTLDALVRLRRLGLLDKAAERRLSDDYVFLRQIEHYLQILEDRQTHVVAFDDTSLHALARRLEGRDADGRTFGRHLVRRMQDIHDLCTAIMTRQYCI